MAKNRNDKNWSMDEVDRLLSRTEKAPQKKEETVVENFARTMRLADTMVTTEVSMEEAARVENLVEDDTIVLSDTARITKERADAVMGVAKADTGDIQISSKTAKQRVSDVLKGLKKAKQQDAEEKTVAVDLGEPLTPKKKHSMETDENRRKFLEVVEVKEDDEADEHTRVVERPGFVMQKKEVSDKTTDLDIMPTLIEAEDFMNNIDIEDGEPEEDIVQDLWAEDQIKLVGFETEELEPETVNEFEAEQNLKVKRREKIDKFKLMGIAEAEEESRATNGKLEKLFGEGSNDDKTDTAAVKNNPVGVEYVNFKDANRIRATLHKAKRLSALRLGAYALISVTMLVANVVSAATVGFDATVSHAVNLVLLIACIVMGMNTINSGVIALLKKQPNLKTSVMLVSAFAFIQCVVSFALEEFFAVEGFVVSSCAAFAFAADEFGDYLRNARTYDAFNFCTGREKENLHSVQRVENKGDEFEVGRVLLMNKPDVRYSCKTNFPSKLIGRCQSEVSSDKLTALLLPMTFAAAALCAIIAGIFSKSLSSAVTSFAAAVCVCVPAFGTAAIQLPLRWVNKRLNKAGGMISGQKAVEDFSRANAIVIDSAELFDQQACRLHGIRDFKKVRIDDLTLYAAAMMVKSGGPLTAVFDQVVSKRDLLPVVHSFNYEERMGVSGWINGQKVIMGNRNMMKLHNMTLPDISEEEKYTYDGRKVIYLAIANQLAAMMVVSYAPNKKLAPFIRRLGTDGVTVLLRNYDSNITTDMINEVFGARFNNIRLISNTSGRIYKKYRNRVRETSKAGILHDGKAFSLFRSFTMSYTLCGTFKVENLIQLINVIVGFAVIAVFSIFDVISITGAWPLLLVQGIMTFAAFFVARIRGIF